MDINHNIEFDNLSSEAKEIIYNVIEKICNLIKKYNIDIVDICNKVNILPDDFMKLLLNPQNDYETYLDILSYVEDMTGRS